jgi:hypothetical protein
MQSSPIVTCHKAHLEAVCRDRGYAVEEAMPCVISQDGDQWSIDTSHPAYPMKPKEGFQPLAIPETHGPGTELRALLSMIGITSSPDCQCNQRARFMDEIELKEPGWCESNLETICDWLQEEATKRNLPFLRMAGKILVRKAIRNARKKGQ